MSKEHPGVHEYQQVASLLAGCDGCRRRQRDLDELRGIIEEQDAQIAEARTAARSFRLAYLSATCSHATSWDYLHPWITESESQAAEDEGQPQPASRHG